MDESLRPAKYRDLKPAHPVLHRSPRPIRHRRIHLILVTALRPPAGTERVRRNLPRPLCHSGHRQRLQPAWQGHARPPRFLARARRARAPDRRPESLLLQGIWLCAGGIFDYIHLVQRDRRVRFRDRARQVIQLRSPKQNGCIVRCQGTWHKELYETSSVAATFDEYRRDARRFVVHHNPIRPHAALAEGRPSGIYANTLERASVATGSPSTQAGKPTPARSVRNTRCNDCIKIDSAALFL